MIIQLIEDCPVLESWDVYDALSWAGLEVKHVFITAICPTATDYKIIIHNQAEVDPKLFWEALANAFCEEVHIRELRTYWQDVIVFLSLDFPLPYLFDWAAS
jgi:hypothetical protein